MKKSLTVYTIIIYLSQVCFVLGSIFCFIEEQTNDSFLNGAIGALFVAGSICAFLGVIAGVACIVIAVCDGINQRGNFATPMFFKLVQLPYFILNFAIWVFASVGKLNFLWILSSFIALFGIYVSFFVMMPTSICSVALLAGKIKRGELPLRKTWIYIVLNFIFFLDIVSAVLLYRNDKKKKLP